MTMAGLAGESQNFDGNGQYVRFQPGGGSQTLSTGRTNFGAAEQFFRLAAPPIGTRPRFPGKRPPYRPDVPCHTNKIPDINSAVVGRPDGGQGPAAGGSDGGGSGGGGLVPQLPGVPQLPIATPRAKQRASVAGELASRLNPFRTSKKARAKQRGRAAYSSSRSSRARSSSTKAAGR
jgi:hypothetical protein